LHVGLIREATNGKPERVTHVLMDNTSPNRNAQAKFEEEFPTLVGLGCQAHGLDLHIKDVSGVSPSKPAKLPQLSKTYATAKMLSNTINDSKKMRHLVQCNQKEEYGKVCYLSMLHILNTDKLIVKLT
jgi:hypothetical protein